MPQELEKKKCCRHTREKQQSRDENHLGTKGDAQQGREGEAVNRVQRKKIARFPCCFPRGHVSLVTYHTFSPASPIPPPPRPHSGTIVRPRLRKARIYTLPNPRKITGSLPHFNWDNRSTVGKVREKTYVSLRACALEGAQRGGGTSRSTPRRERTPPCHCHCHCCLPFFLTPSPVSSGTRAKQR